VLHGDVNDDVGVIRLPVLWHGRSSLVDADEFRVGGEADWNREMAKFDLRGHGEGDRTSRSSAPSRQIDLPVTE
jgi:hypothetical protein